MPTTDLDNRFTYHAPCDVTRAGLTQVQRYTALRESARLFALQIEDMTPDGREKSLAITKLEEVVMWANAGIARNEK